MSRWLIHFLCSVLLLCYGASAVAQTPAWGDPSQALGASAPMAGVTGQAPDQAAVVQTTLTAALEGALDYPELFADLHASTPVPLLAGAVHRLNLLSLVPPYLAGLERPPRAELPRL